MDKKTLLLTTLFAVSIGINIGLIAFLVRSGIGKTQSETFSQNIPQRDTLPTGYLRFLLEGPILKIYKDEEPKRIIINAQLQMIDPKAQPQEVELYLSANTQITDINGQAISFENLGEGDYVKVNTYEDPIYLLSNGQLTRNKFTAKSITQFSPALSPRQKKAVLF